MYSVRLNSLWMQWVTLLNVFTTLGNGYFSNNLMYNYFQGSLYGPNFEETAGDLQMSTCSVTPIYDDAGDFTSCTGDLHYLGVGFVTQETAGLPLSTTPVPEQGRYENCGTE